MKKFFVETDFAKLDVARKQRTGFPETVFCLGKSKEQVADILQNFASVGQNVLGTKCSPEQFDFALKKGLPVKYDSLSRVISLGQKETNPFRGNIAVCCAGTSDLPILEEAAQVAEFFGAVVERYVDIGVAGIQRLFAQIDNIQKADVVIAVAGMEGALASVLAGLVRTPVIAVPTSVGYGASFHGLAAMLAMLNSCAEGVSVVNIDNGFGAAVQACRILALKGRMND